MTESGLLHLASRPAAPRPRGRGPGLRLRLTLLATGLTAGVSAVLLWLGWLLVGSVVTAVPELPAGTSVRIQGVDVPAEQLAGTLQSNAQDKVLQYGTAAFLCVVLAAAVLAWALTGRLLRPDNAGQAILRILKNIKSHGLRVLFHHK